MLVEASISDGATEAAIKLDNGSTPKFWSSHEIFLEFVNSQAADGSETIVAVEAWECQSFLTGKCHLKSAPETLKASFSISTEPVERKQNKKRSAKLPFGLKMPRKKKRKQNRKHARRTASASVQLQHAQIPGSSSETDPDLDVGPESAEDDNDEIDPNQESEQTVPVSEAVQAGLQEIPQVAQEIQSADVLKDEVAASIKQDQDRLRRGSTYFSTELGLAEGSIAISGRSQCLHCKTPIPKGSVRFAWQYSTVRPPGWLHNYCLSAHIKQNDDLQVKSKEFLTNLVASYKSGTASSSSGFRRNPPAAEVAEVAEVAMKVLSILSAS